MKRIHLMSAASVCLAVLSAPGVLAATYDLSNDWSDSANPNGPWSYRVGTTILPHTASWTAGVNFPVVQPAYQPSNSPGDFLPAWFKATSVPPLFDNQIGDVIVHTNDNSNGSEGDGVANVLFTTPVAGQYDITGGLWNATTALVPGDFAPRPQDWQLLVNGSVVASGLLDGLPGDVTRAKRQTFDLSNITLAAGEAVELDVYRDTNAQAGFFVGTMLTIQSVPEPTSVVLLAVGTGLVVARIRRRAPTGNTTALAD